MIPHYFISTYISSTKETQLINNITNLNEEDKYKLYSEYVKIRIICNEENEQTFDEKIIEGIYKLNNIDDLNNKPVYSKETDLDNNPVDTNEEGMPTCFWFDDSKCVIGQDGSNITKVLVNIIP